MSQNPETVTPDGGRTAETENPPPEEEYARVLFTDEALPAPVGEIAMTFKGIPTDRQRMDADAFYAFLKENRNQLRLNVGAKLLSAFVIDPESSKVLVIYGLGFGTADIGS